jgi:hypothetical protein
MPSSMELADAAVWLSSHARVREPVGVELGFGEDGTYVLILAGAEPNDAIGLSGQASPDDPGVQVLRRALESKDGIDLVPFSAAAFVASAAELTGLSPHVVLERVAGDVAAISYTLGHVPPMGESAVEAVQNAIRFWIQAQRSEMPAYYRQVAVPLSRLLAAPPEPQGAEFEIAYPDLFMRVVGRYSGEPTFIRAVQAGDAPHMGSFERAHGEYPSLTPGSWYAALLWTALGGDFEFMQEAYPQQAELLADFDLERLAMDMQRLVPSVVLMAKTIIGQPGGVREFRTLYGRRRQLVSGQGPETPGFWLDFVLAGTVQDIINVATITAANLGLLINPTSGSDETNRRLTVRGWAGDRDRDELVADLRGVAHLGGPLQPIPLNPVVSVE